MRTRNEHAPLLLIVAGITSAIGALFIFPIRAPGTAWLVLPMLALVTEFLPVQFHRRGIRVTFSLPFIAGMAVVAGIPGAIIADLAVGLAASAVLTRSDDREASRLRTVSLSVGALSVFFAGALMSLVQGDTLGGVMAQATVFTLAHGLTNLLLLSWLDSARHPLSIGSIISKGALPLSVYCLLAVAVASLAWRDAVWALPLALGPVLGIRGIVKAQATAGNTYYEAITTLAMMLQRAHPYTHRHLARVALASEEVAIRLGLGAKRARLVREAAILHDLGKIAVDEDVLDKPAKLTPEEFDHVKQHSLFGEKILAPVAEFREMRTWIRHHHERPDGTGYPDQLRDSQIPIESKIIAVVDAYDAMTGGAEGRDKRSYRDPMTPAEAVAELERCSGTQFDRAVVKTFRRVIAGGTI
ncbi:MAG: HD domain-containing phosphohydrolase [Fimbriimonadaceae bacterium]